MSEDAQTAPGRRTFLSALGVYGERRSLVMIALGFSAALPYFLIFDTLSLWLRSSEISLEIIGFFSLVTFISSLKFIWAPFVDRGRIPILTALVGHRRSWMLVCQGVVMLGLWLIAASDPLSGLGRIAMFAVLVGFGSATQDIAIDAWRIEAADASRQGAMAAAYQWGYRVGIITAGAVPLLLAEIYGWNFSYAIMAALMAVGMVAVLAAPREQQHVIRAINTGDIPPAPAREGLEWVGRLALLVVGVLVLGSGLAANAGILANVLRAAGAAGVADRILATWASDGAVVAQLAAVVLGLGLIGLIALPLPGARTRPGVYLSSALVDPLRDFFMRYHSVAGLILALICLYRIPDFVMNIVNPFYLDLGYSLTEIAEVRKIFGVFMTMFGVFAGGLLVARYGLLRAMLVGAFAGPLSNLLFVWLAFQDHNLLALFAAIGLDNVAGGIAGTCLIAYMSSLTSRGFTATQYALFSSLYAIPGRLIASQSGRIVEGAARMADEGGVLSGIRNMFATYAPDNFAAAIERSGVTPAALGTGYTVFFTYSALIGVFGVMLSVAVLRRQEGDESVPDAAGAAARPAH
ncbi:MAG: AmpG family muropeptide MFS transporter [Acidimicrobiia bacterium]|nr:AmpG family muropeptide MFS transporter [Acidimicrobiia bacterium]